MFTGIVEELGKIVSVEPKGSNITFQIQIGLEGITVDDSISCNGICLTVEKVHHQIYTFTAIAETIAKTNAGSWVIGDLINIERTLPFNGRIDGHLVQGHVDGKGKSESIEEKNGSREYVFSFDNKFRNLIIEKGSICVNGTSLTAFDVGDNVFRVAIIPYTYEHTTFHTIKRGDFANLEFDIVGKYIERYMSGRDAKK